jgi:hypothetical protein
MPRVRQVLLDKQEAEGFITVPEASKRTAVAERSIRTWTRNGKVRVRRVGGLVFVELASLLEEVGA